MSLTDFSPQNIQWCRCCGFTFVRRWLEETICTYCIDHQDTFPCEEQGEETVPFA